MQILLKQKIIEEWGIEEYSIVLKQEGFSTDIFLENVLKIWGISAIEIYALKTE